jgi:hypothetical protein
MNPPLSLVTALLAQAAGFPTGDTAQGVELSLVLTPDGRLDPESYLNDPRPWHARRFRPDREDWHGELVRESESWALRGAPEADGPLWFLETDGLRPGAYLLLRRPDGESLTFRIVSVTPA